MRSTRCPSSALRSLLVVCALPLLCSPALAAASYTYDALGRLIAVTYSDGKQITYSYDAAGNRTQHIVSPTTTNGPPVAVADAVTINENLSSISFDPRVNDTDPDSNALTLFSVTSGQLGSAALSNGGSAVVYSTTSKRNGTDTLNYVITDGHGMEASAEIAVTLANLSPVVVADTVSTPRNIPKSFDPRSNDSDPGGDTFTITAISNPAHGVVTNMAGTAIYYSPATGYYGPDSFTYTVTDVDGGIATGTVSVNVTFGTQAPVAVNDTIAVLKNVARTFDPRKNDSDPDGTALTITAKTNGSKGTVTINSGTSLTYTPNTNQTGADSFTYTIADIDGLTATATVNINIQATNSAPVTSADTVELYGTYGPGNTNGTQPTGNIDPRWNDSDPDGNTFTVTAVTQPTNGTATILSNGSVSIWRNTVCPGLQPVVGNVTYTVTDELGASSTGTISNTRLCESNN